MSYSLSGPTETKMCFFFFWMLQALTSMFGNRIKFLWQLTQFYSFFRLYNLILVSPTIFVFFLSIGICDARKHHNIILHVHTHTHKHTHTHTNTLSYTDTHTRTHTLKRSAHSFSLSDTHAHTHKHTLRRRKKTFRSRKIPFYTNIL